MSRRAAAFENELAARTGDRTALRFGIAELEELYLRVIRAYLPPNPQFERERILTSLPNRREIVFVLGLLSEGENEAALLLDLMHRVRESEPAAPTAHLLDEAWYYLRTSVDERWQLDAAPPSTPAALAYLYAVLELRLERLTARAPAVPTREEPAAARALLESLRERLPNGAA